LQDLKPPPPVPLVPAHVTRGAVQKVAPLAFLSLFFSGYYIISELGFDQCSYFCSVPSAGLVTVMRPSGRSQILKGKIDFEIIFILILIFDLIFCIFLTFKKSKSNHSLKFWEEKNQIKNHQN